jgi:integrase
MSDIHRKRRSAFKSDSRNTTLRNQTCRAVAHPRLHADPADGLFYMALGVPVHVVAARLGHADPSVTLRVYSHMLREHAQGIGDVFAQAIKASVSKSVSNGRNDS